MHKALEFEPALQREFAEVDSFFERALDMEYGGWDLFGEKRNPFKDRQRLADARERGNRIAAVRREAQRKAVR